MMPRVQKSRILTPSAHVLLVYQDWNVCVCWLLCGCVYWGRKSGQDPSSQQVSRAVALPYDAAVTWVELNGLKLRTIDFKKKQRKYTVVFVKVCKVDNCIRITWKSCLKTLIHLFFHWTSRYWFHVCDRHSVSSYARAKQETGQTSSLTFWNIQFTRKICCCLVSKFVSDSFATPGTVARQAPLYI